MDQLRILNLQKHLERLEREVFRLQASEHLSVIHWVRYRAAQRVVLAL